jgi:hypothetical protein
MTSSKVSPGPFEERSIVPPNWLIPSPIPASPTQFRCAYLEIASAKLQGYPSRNLAPSN